MGLVLSAPMGSNNKLRVLSLYRFAGRILNLVDSTSWHVKPVVVVAMVETVLPRPFPRKDD